MAVILSIVFSPGAQAEEPVLLILDPGHGGSDQGGYDNRGFVHEGKRVPEDALTYDVARRISRKAHEWGWTTAFTVIDPEDASFPRDISGTLLTPGKGMKYAPPHENKGVVSGKDGLERRLDAAVYAARRFSGYRTIFISLHFDFAPEFVGGARIFTPREEPIHPFARILANELYNAGLGLMVRSQSKPFIDNNNRLYVLEHGTITPRILIELGNFNDKSDRALMLSPAGRQRYAQIIIRAIERYLQ